MAGGAATGHRVLPLGPRQCRAFLVVPPWAALYGLVRRLALQRLARTSFREVA